MIAKNNEEYTKSFGVDNKDYNSSEMNNTNKIDDMTKLAGTIETLALLKTLKETPK